MFKSYSQKIKTMLFYVNINAFQIKIIKIGAVNRYNRLDFPAINTKWDVNNQALYGFKVLL